MAQGCDKGLLGGPSVKQPVATHLQKEREGERDWLKGKRDER